MERQIQRGISILKKEPPVEFGIVLRGESLVGAGIIFIFGLNFIFGDIPVHVPGFSNSLEFLAFYIFGLEIVTIPFIVHGQWDFGKRKFTP